MSNTDQFKTGAENDTFYEVTPSQANDGVCSIKCLLCGATQWTREPEQAQSRMDVHLRSVCPFRTVSPMLVMNTCGEGTTVVAAHELTTTQFDGVLAYAALANERGSMFAPQIQVLQSGDDSYVFAKEVWLTSILGEELHEELCQ
jgi:hypothetical protein